MAAVTRQGDSTTGVCNLGLPCCPHGRSGTNQTDSPNVYVNGKPVHRLHDTGPTNCPHGGTFQSVGGSSTVFINGQPATRIGDTTTCLLCGQSGSHSSGSPNVFIGG
ncbi:PAAR domain-containing protein [Pelosinus sp. IPA-1]|uniref:PAAR domain-containing protein n=1 Tax=Pelosinus sp. IPA-1 TaxID=3029569 RepID=UPI00243629E2|nr:PAAR domain-containing protein [Pelosinus sp. IPA-1]GMB00930.1 hypothetical protein PIPA1_37290 [Pelosinus sp. IPA-1]